VRLQYDVDRFFVFIRAERPPMASPDAFVARPTKPFGLEGKFVAVWLLLSTKKRILSVILALGLNSPNAICGVVRHATKCLKTCQKAQTDYTDCLRRYFENILRDNYTCI